MANIFLTQVPGEGGFNWMNGPNSISYPVGAPANSTAILATLVATPDPTGDSLGGSGVIGSNIYHVTIAPASGPGTYVFAHGLLYTPLVCWGFLRIAEGTTPSSFFGFDIGDTNTGTIAVNLSGSGTWDVYYG